MVFTLSKFMTTTESVYILRLGVKMCHHFLRQIVQL